LRLAKQLGVGITAVREALFELERTGLVTRIPRKGSFITKMSAEEAKQIFRVRKDSKHWPWIWPWSTLLHRTWKHCRFGGRDEDFG